MITFLGKLIRIFFHAFRSRWIILSENALLKKENDILLRRVRKQQVHFNIYDKRFFRTVRREALDNFLLTGKTQVQRRPCASDQGRLRTIDSTHLSSGERDTS